MKKNRNDEFGSWGAVVWAIAIAVFFAWATFGCSTANFALNKLQGDNKSPAEIFTLDEEDILVRMDAYAEMTPKDPTAILHNPADDTYVLKAAYYKKLLLLAVKCKEYEERIDTAIENYDPETLGSALAHDAGTAGLTLLLLGIIGAALY